MIAALLAVLRAARALPDAIRGQPPVRSDDPAAVEEADASGPDPARGVFETLLVRDREPVRVELHLARLGRSVESLYGALLPEDLAERTRRVAHQAQHARLRITAVPAAADFVEVSVELSPLSQRELPIELHPVRRTGGLGAHKWCDRTWLDSVSDGRHTPLILDSDGCVLEAAWGNVIAVRGEAMYTPATDGRLLPGVTRATLLRAVADYGQRVVEGPLTLADAENADLLFVTSSIASVVPAVLSPGQPVDLARARALTLLLEARALSRA